MDRLVRRAKNPASRARLKHAVPYHFAVRLHRCQKSRKLPSPPIVVTLLRSCLLLFAFYLSDWRPPRSLPVSASGPRVRIPALRRGARRSLHQRGRAKTDPPQPTLEERSVG